MASACQFQHPRSLLAQAARPAPELAGLTPRQVVRSPAAERTARSRRRSADAFVELQSPRLAPTAGRSAGDVAKTCDPAQIESIDLSSNNTRTLSWSLRRAGPAAPSSASSVPVSRGLVFDAPAAAHDRGHREVKGGRKWAVDNWTHSRARCPRGAARRSGSRSVTEGPKRKRPHEGGRFGVSFGTSASSACPTRSAECPSG